MECCANLIFETCEILRVLKEVCGQGCHGGHGRFCPSSHHYVGIGTDVFFSQGQVATVAKSKADEVRFVALSTKSMVYEVIRSLEISLAAPLRHPGYSRAEQKVDPGEFGES